MMSLMISLKISVKMTSLFVYFIEQVYAIWLNVNPVQGILCFLFILLNVNILQLYTRIPLFFLIINFFAVLKLNFNLGTTYRL